jgi:hypothetical protein
MKCRVCNTEDPDKPMCFRMTEACCENHRKIIDGELPATYAQLAVMDKDLYQRLIELEINEDREDRE